jgi:hypothetical protein
LISKLIRCVPPAAERRRVVRACSSQRWQIGYERWLVPGERQVLARLALTLVGVIQRA